MTKGRSWGSRGKGSLCGDGETRSRCADAVHDDSCRARSWPGVSVEGVGCSWGPRQGAVDDAVGALLARAIHPAQR